MYQCHSLASLPAGPSSSGSIITFPGLCSFPDQVNLRSCSTLGMGISRVGHPIVFAGGQFSGCTIRMELSEIQKADLGRKYARVDRRPLDPPPVVQLRIFQVEQAGTEMEVETELDYEDIQVLGFICTVDLFPVPDYFAPSQSPRGGSRTGKVTNKTLRFTSRSPPSTCSTQSCQQELRTPSRAHNMYSADWPYQLRFAEFPNGMFQTQAITNPRAIHRLGNYCITEKTKLTWALAGATFVQAAEVDYQGKKAILFAFSDVAVKIEGAFILRYRVFDLFSLSRDGNAVVGAETYGGPFRIYSTKDFPGLQASTDLTKNLARWGVRLNIRETERRRKKMSDDSESL